MKRENWMKGDKPEVSLVKFAIGKKYSYIKKTDVTPARYDRPPISPKAEFVMIAEGRRLIQHGPLAGQIQDIYTFKLPKEEADRFGLRITQSIISTRVDVADATWELIDEAG